jgi:hypothetical protein
MNVMRFIVFLLTAALFLPLAHASEDVLISEWQVTLGPDSDQGASVEMYMKVSTQAYSIETIIISFNADSAEYLPPSILGGKKEELGDVGVASSGGMTTATIDMVKPIMIGEEREIKLDFTAGGIFEASSADFKLGTPRAGLDTGEEVDIITNPGTIRLHAPAGYLPGTSVPDFWRDVWQGVSGFNSHFLLIYDTVPFDEGVKATFIKSAVVEKASEVDNAIEEAEDTATDEQISRARTHLGNALDILRSKEGTEEEADAELEKAFEALSGTTSSTFERTPSSTEDTASPKSICGPTSLLVLASFATLFRRRSL